MTRWIPPAVLLLFFAAAPAPAWTDGTQERIAENAALLMPESLRYVMAIHKDRLLAGAREAARRGGDADHFQNLDSGSGNLAGAIELQARKVLGKLNSRAPMTDIVYEMGVLSHFVADAQNPLVTSSREPREAEYAADFEAYVERKLDRFPLVFYGYASDHLQAEDYRGFAMQALTRSSRYYDWLSQDYIRGGELVRSEAFSDFSFAFGAGQLAFSHGVCDVAAIWLHLWRSASGDIGGLPMTQAPVRIPQAR